MGSIEVFRKSKTKSASLPRISIFEVFAWMTHKHTLMFPYKSSKFDLDHEVLIQVKDLLEVITVKQG